MTTDSDTQPGSVSSLFRGVLGISFLTLVLCLIFIFSHRYPTRTRGKELKNHAIFAATAALTFLLPIGAKQDLFNNLTVVVAGTIYPVYESLRAVCTIGSKDDTSWLSYWIIHGITAICTSWVKGAVHWNMVEFFFLIWLYLPWTDGTDLLHDNIIIPFVAPAVQPLAKKMDGLVSKIMMAATNASHMGFVYFAYAFLNSCKYNAPHMCFYYYSLNLSIVAKRF